VNNFRYILRYCIDPTCDVQARIDELVQYCIESKTEEVMLFSPAEELSTGHPTLEELEPYVNLAINLKKVLSGRNIELSLNPWSTLYHVERGRRLKPGQDWQLMVGETGCQNKLAACPLCHKWQKYICKIFCYLTQCVKPIAIWVEDDWRLHNHDIESGFGGCFCDLHLARFSKAVGTEVTRELLLQNILAPGKPHPWRKKWLELSRESLLEPALKLADTVRKANPSTRLGLMSSVPDVHSAEGRDWYKLQNTLSPSELPFLIRPHLPPYTEMTAIQSPPSVTRHTIANLKRPLNIYPELENCPRNGLYTKSASFCLWECFNTAIFGCHGITINHFDMMGNGINLDNTIGKVFGKSKDMLNALKALDVDDQNSLGVNVFFKPDVAEHIHSTSSSSLFGLCQDSVVWSKIFYVLGVTHKFIKSIPERGVPVPVAVGSQTLRALNKTDIEKLLSGTVLLDAVCIEILLEKGMGHLAGIKDASWKRQRETGYSYESINYVGEQKYGIANPRVTAQRCGDKMLAMNCCDSAISLSTVHRYDHQYLFPGCILFENVAGGKVASFAYPFDNDSKLFMCFFNKFRLRMLQDIIFEISTPQAAIVNVSNHPASCYAVKTNKGLLISAFNIIADESHEFIFETSQGLICPDKLHILDKKGNWQKYKAEIMPCKKKDLIKVTVPAKYLEGVFLLNMDEK